MDATHLNVWLRNRARTDPDSATRVVAAGRRAAVWHRGDRVTAFGLAAACQVACELQVIVERHREWLAARPRS